MTAERHLSWESFLKSFIEPSVAALHPVAGTPSVDLFVDPGATRIGLRVPWTKADDPRTAAWNYAQMELSPRIYKGSAALELTVSDPRLFEAFYAACVRICDMIQLRNMDPLEAAQSAAREMGDLLARRPRLPPEAETGLWGELWVLRLLLDLRGVTCSESWVGWDKQAHDFRLNTAELEVKTTRAELRKHLITTLTQLLPSPGRSLHLVSLQITPAGAAGAGASLPDMVSSVTRSMLGNTDVLDRFQSRLAAVGYLAEDAGMYPDKFILRSDPVAMRVDAGFPRLSPESLNLAMTADQLTRISDIQYRVDVEGLGEVLDKAKLEGIFNGTHAA